MAAFTHQPPATLAEASTRIAELTGSSAVPIRWVWSLKQFGLQRRKQGDTRTGSTAARRAEQRSFETQALTPRLQEARQSTNGLFDATRFVGCS